MTAIDIRECILSITAVCIIFEIINHREYIIYIPILLFRFLLYLNSIHCKKISNQRPWIVDRKVARDREVKGRGEYNPLYFRIVMAILQ